MAAAQTHTKSDPAKISRGVLPAIRDSMLQATYATRANIHQSLRTKFRSEVSFMLGSYGLTWQTKAVRLPRDAGRRTTSIGSCREI
jgi:hypothetical protein